MGIEDENGLGFAVGYDIRRTSITRDENVDPRWSQK